LKAIHNFEVIGYQDALLFLKVKDTNFESNSQQGSWYTVFDGSGKKIKDIAASSVGDLCGIGSDFIVFVKGSWYSTYDETGRKIKDAAVSSLGDFRNASGSTIIFKKGSWIGTYDKTFKKLSERAG